MNIADLAHRLRVAQDEERAAGAELKAAETELRDLRDAHHRASNQLAGYRQATARDYAQQIDSAQAEQARLQPLIQAAEARVTAVQDRIEQTRTAQASLTEGQETALAVWFYHDATAQADQARVALEEMTARLGQAEQARASAVAVYVQAEQARNLALDESAMSGARQRMDQVKAAVEDAEVLVANLNRAAADLLDVLTTAQAAVETARRNVWHARRNEVLTAMRPDLAARLTDAYVASVAAGNTQDFATFVRATVETARPPADLDAIRDRTAADLGVPPSRSKAPKVDPV